MEQETRQSYSKKQRIAACLALLIIACLLLALLFCLVAGASAGTILAILFCLIVVPCIFYALKLYLDHTARKR